MKKPLETLLNEKRFQRELLWKNPGPADRKTVDVVHLPDILAVGFLGNPPPETDPAVLQGATARERGGLQMILTSANPVPPSQLAGWRQVLEFLETKEFRAVLGLSDLRFELNRRHEFLSGSAEVTAEPGYTPIGPPGLRVMYEPGIGRDPAPKVEAEADNRVTITLELRFRIGRVPAAAGALLTGYWPSSVGIRMQLEVVPAGLERISVWCTPLPSLAVYRNGQGVVRYDCFAEGFQNVLDFMRLDGKNAEMRLVYQEHFSPPLKRSP